MQKWSGALICILALYRTEEEKPIERYKARIQIKEEHHSISPWEGGGDSNITKGGDARREFEIDPKGRPTWVWLAHFLTPKRDVNKTSFKKTCCISSRATLSETSKAKNIGDLSSTP